MRAVHLRPGWTRHPAAADGSAPGTGTHPVDRLVPVGDDEPVDGITVRAWVDDHLAEYRGEAVGHDRVGSCGPHAGAHPDRDPGAPDTGSPRPVTVRSLRAALSEVTAAGGFLWVSVHDPDDRAAQVVHRALEMPAKVLRSARAPRADPQVGAAADRHRQVRPQLRVGPEFVALVLKSAWYVDHPESTGVADIRDDGDCVAVVTRHWALTARHGPTRDLDRVADAVAAWPDAGAHGPSLVLAAVLAASLASYGRVADEVQLDLDELAGDVFAEEGDPPIEKSYRLKRELSTLRGATGPLAPPIGRLVDERTPCVTDRTRSVLRELGDQLDRVRASVRDLDELLDSVNDAAQARVSQQQNDDMRKISAWVAIAAVPTLLAGIYGMNFQHMPELGWRFGYPLTIGVMLVICVGLYLAFKRRHWL